MLPVLSALFLARFAVEMPSMIPGRLRLFMLLFVVFAQWW